MIKAYARSDVGKIREKNEEMAKDALRVLGCAYKEIDHIPSKEEMKQIENDLIFIGMVGMIDPPREEAKVAVRAVRRDGIDEAKTKQKNSEITEDELKNAENDIQKLTDKKIEEVDKILENKEKEIMSI